MISVFEEETDWCDRIAATGKLEMRRKDSCILKKIVHVEIKTQLPNPPS